MRSVGRARRNAQESRNFYKNAFKLPRVSGFLAALSINRSINQQHIMKKLISFRVTTLALLASSIFKTASVDADVTFLGVAAGDATSNEVIVWTRAEDESNPQPKLQPGKIGATHVPGEQPPEDKQQAVWQPGTTFTPFWEPWGVSEDDLYR
jgi:hypothetical protein